VLGETTCIVSGLDESTGTSFHATRLKIYHPARSYLTCLRITDRPSSLLEPMNYRVWPRVSSQCVLAKNFWRNWTSVSADLYFASQVEACLGHLQCRDETLTFLLYFIFLCHFSGTECVLYADILRTPPRHQQFPVVNSVYFRILMFKYRNNIRKGDTIARLLCCVYVPLY
jgi:hypothetical protein